MSLLSNEKIKQLEDRHVTMYRFDPLAFARAIEAAVLEQFAQGVKVQIPSNTFEQEMQNQRRIGYEQGKKAAVLEAQGKQEPFPFSAKRVTYHKAAPVVQPDMVMVPRNPTQAMRDAGNKTLDRLKKEPGMGTADQAFYAYGAMIAAAEGKK